MTPPRRILLIRTSALGDVVHVLPVLTALRRHLPQARLGWVVEEAMAPVLAGHPDLDELLVVRLRPWRKAPFAAETRRQIQDFLRALRCFDADVALDLMGNHKAGVIAALSGADRRIGLARPFRREPSSALWINEGVARRGAHAVDQALAVLDALEVPPGPAGFAGDRLFRDSPEPARAFLDGAPPFALIHPGAGWVNKACPAAGLATWVAVAPGEEHLAAEIEATSDGAARAVPAPDLPTLAALLRAARLVLGGDTGPVHLAHALGTPVLMVMGPTDPARHGPYGAPERALSARLPCSACYQRLPEVKLCLLEISPARVAERAVELIEGR